MDVASLVPPLFLSASYRPRLIEGVYLGIQEPCRGLYVVQTPDFCLAYGSTGSPSPAVPGTRRLPRLLYARVSRIAHDGRRHRFEG